jgi:predicted TIM-barrel fold metal-dependent hydrolase
MKKFDEGDAWVFDWIPTTPVNFGLRSYITDTYGLENRHEIGVDNIMWSSDYPLLGADWPHSWRVIEEVMADIPEEEKNTILAGNAVNLCHLPHDPTGVSTYDQRVDARHA